jgi:hypothetical protein
MPDSTNHIHLLTERASMKISDFGSGGESVRASSPNQLRRRLE